MEKVKLPKEVAKAIEAMRAEKFTNGAIIREMLTENAAWNESKTMLDFASDSDENFDLFFQALVNGYEVEETPEEWLSNEYGKQSVCNNEWSKGYCKGIEMACEALNIKIEGVNT